MFHIKSWLIGYYGLKVLMLDQGKGIRDEKSVYI